MSANYFAWKKFQLADPAFFFVLIVLYYYNRIPQPVNLASIGVHS